MEKKYVVVDIGCLECVEPSCCLGIFTDLELAKEILVQAKESQHRHWNGEHFFEIFEVLAENTIAFVPYYMAYDYPELVKDDYDDEDDEDDEE